LFYPKENDRFAINTKTIPQFFFNYRNTSEHFVLDIFKNDLTDCSKIAAFSVLVFYRCDCDLELYCLKRQAEKSVSKCYFQKYNSMALARNERGQCQSKIMREVGLLLGNAIELLALFSSGQT